MAFCLNNYFFSTFLGPRGQVLFSTALNLMKEHSRPCCVLTTKRLLPPSGRILPRVNNTVHKVNRPNQGQIYTIPQSGRTNSGSNLHKSTKRTGPNKGQHQSTKWTDQPGSNLYESTKWTNPTKGQHQSTKWTDPTRVKLIRVQKADEPYQWSTPVHKVDGPN